jgi:hypothetical protein
MSPSNNYVEIPMLPADSSHRDHSRRSLSPSDNPLVRAIGRVLTTVQRKLLVALALVAILLVTVGVLGLGALNASNGRVETLGLLSQQRDIYGELQLYSGLLSDQLSTRDEVVSACESSVCDLQRVALLFDTDTNIQTWLASVGSLSIAQPGAPPADQKLLGEIHSRYVDIYQALPRLLTADNNTAFAESGPYLDNRRQDAYRASSRPAASPDPRTPARPVRD